MEYEMVIKIRDYLMEELDYVYCTNCKKGRMSESDENWDCDDCHRKSMNWQLSEDRATVMARQIFEMDK